MHFTKNRAPTDFGQNWLGNQGLWPGVQMNKSTMYITSIHSTCSRSCTYVHQVMLPSQFFNFFLLFCFESTLAGTCNFTWHVEAAAISSFHMSIAHCSYQSRQNDKSSRHKPPKLLQVLALEAPYLDRVKMRFHVQALSISKPLFVTS